MILLTRRERAFREARQSPALFIGVLTELINSGDEAALKNFLAYCDIPLLDAERPRLFYHLRPQWEGTHGMLILGEQNLRIFADLHKAVIGFVDRHYRRLRRHTKSLNLDGSQNFMHLFLAMGGVLRAQIERAIQGLRFVQAPLDSQKWFEYRVRVDLYLGKFQEFCRCLRDEYLFFVIKRYKVKRVYDRIEPDLEPFFSVCEAILQCRDRIEVVRTSTLKVWSARGSTAVPPYFDSRLSEKNWPRYRGEIQDLIEQVREAFRA